MPVYFDCSCFCSFLFFFFFNDTATTEIYTLSLHDALPICGPPRRRVPRPRTSSAIAGTRWESSARFETAFTLKSSSRSEEHTSELQSRPHLVCRLLLEKKKQRSKSLVAITVGNGDVGCTIC